MPLWGAPTRKLMRILLLTQFYPPEFGAASIRLGRLAQMLVDAGHDVRVLTSMPNYPTGIIPEAYRRKIFARERQDGVEVVRVWVYASPKKSMRRRLLNQWTFMLTSAIRGTFLSRPDVILVESHPLFVCLTGGWLSRIKRAPIVLNVSDLWPESAVAVGALSPDSRMVKAAAKVERWAYRDAAHIVAMTEGVKEGILCHLERPERVTKIQNAVDLERFQPGLAEQGRAMRQRLGIGDEIVVGHIGNMSLAHDFDLLVDAAAALPRMTFVFAGSGSLLEHVQARIQDEQIGNILLPGVLPHGDMPALWAAVDICAIAFRSHALFEGALPSKMFEAMATGTPVVAAAQGETQRLLENTGAGVAVQSGDRSALIEQLQRLAKEPDKRKVMALAGREYALQNLSALRVRDSFLKIFDRVVEGRRRH
ncbi:MAG: glycosyltransferase family 4 protein [Anaerolineae bacterium]|nr:glycosyltransferase family 4 protein [Anaerolineae bacterium]